MGAGQAGGWLSLREGRGMNPLSPDLVEAMVRRYKAGNAVGDIARALGVSPRVVESKLYKMRKAGLVDARVMRWTKDRCATLDRYLSLGLNSAQIADKMGLTQSQVYKKIVKSGRTKHLQRGRPRTKFGVVRKAEPAPLPPQNQKEGSLQKRAHATLCALYEPGRPVATRTIAHRIVPDQANLLRDRIYSLLHSLEGRGFVRRSSDGWIPLRRPNGDVWKPQDDEALKAAFIASKGVTKCPPAWELAGRPSPFDRVSNHMIVDW